MKKRLLYATILVWFAATGSSRGESKAPGEGEPVYEKQIRPIFKAHCFECHGEGEKLKAGLDLRLRRLAVQGGKSGPGLVPGKRDDSLIYQRIHDLEMPPGKTKLAKNDIELIGRWIAGGARTAAPEPANVAPGLLFTEAERAYWAFQPIRRPALPSVHAAARLRTPIDSFILSRLEEKNLPFGAEAEKRTLIRRVSFDLLGLPPTPEEVEKFLSDTRPDSYERLIDRLLESPHYGERWGRHWLDVAGYADSEGYTNDDPIRTNAYKYRDYVIRSFNADKPFDQFIQEQLAGDEMVAPPYKNLQPEQIEKLIATGFLRMAPDGTGGRGAEQASARNQVTADTLKIVSTAFLGLTMGCAQCHNHRYDPIPQADYYRLRAVFEPAYDWKNWRSPQQREVSLYTDEDRKKAAAVEQEAAAVERERLKKQQDYIEKTFEKELAKLPESLRETARAARNAAPGKRTADQQKLLKEYPSLNVSAGSLYLYDSKAAADLTKQAAQAAAIRGRKPVEEFVRALTEVPGQLPATYLFHRGDYQQPKEALQPGDLTILASLNLAPIPVKDSSLPSSGRRLAYARHLTDGKHPLTARVLVNRVWMHHFGRGIVATPGDFGVLGEKPTHPELLDWLASEFMDGGWRLKPLHKLILTSSTYRQASARDLVKDKIDPDNRLYGRMSVRRLDAEIIRDSILAVSGKLNAKSFGSPVPVMIDDVGQFVIGIDNTDSAGRPSGKMAPMFGEEFRRSVYVQVRRTRPLAVLDTFDAPVMEPNCDVRSASTVTPQALMLMNSPFVVSQTEHFADRLRKEAGENPAAQVTLAWRLAFGTEPTEAEVHSGTQFLVDQTIQFRANPTKDKTDPGQRALASFCHALLSANQFLYLD